LAQATLEAPDISCDHCIQTIMTAVEKIPGVRFVSADIPAKQVTVEFEPGDVALGDIEAAMEEEGYPVKK
jgi:copper chaperone